MEKKITIENGGMRLDKYMTEILTDISRSQIQKMIDEGEILVNEIVKKSNYKVEAGDVVSYQIIEKDTQIIPQEMNLDILYEDDDLLVVNKPIGLIVHPAESNEGQVTLVHGLLAHTQGQLSDINGEMRPGIVHRLDKDTSGLLVVAKNNKTHQALSQAFIDKTIEREYYVIVDGNFKHKHAHVDAPIGRDPMNRQRMKVTHINGKEARTDFYQVESHPKMSLLRAKLDTGRTHQIRLHALFMNHPVIGDELYGTYKKAIKGHALHAYRVKFIHPTTQEVMEFKTEIPERFNELMEEMRRL